MANLDVILSSHRKVALQFSGGRDSLAMLLYLQPYWNDLTVYFCDSGEALPETLELVERVKRLVPNFIRVPGKVQEVRERDGWPADVIPARSGFLYGPGLYTRSFPVISRELCCFKSLMAPLQAAMLTDKITLVLRGQRDSDYPKNPLPSGTVEGGIMVVYPIQTWTTEEVEDYISASGWAVPSYYAEGMTSAPDCMHCTAWLEHGALRYLDKHHKHSAGVVRGVLTQMINSVEPAYTRMVAEAREIT